MVQFFRSRGGWIVSAAMLAVLVKTNFHSLDWIDAAIVASVIGAWPTLEWFFHRFLMHEWNCPMFRWTHARHHDNPTTDNGLPEPIVIWLYYVGGAVFCCMPRMMTTYATVLCMLTAYEFIHFACHVNYKPKTWWGWAIRVNHLQHHRVNEHGQYAMLFPFLKQEPLVEKSAESVIQAKNGS